MFWHKSTGRSKLYKNALHRRFENTKKQPSFCEQGHTATLLTIYHWSCQRIRDVTLSFVWRRWAKEPWCREFSLIHFIPIHVINFWTLKSFFGRNHFWTATWIESKEIGKLTWLFTSWSLTPETSPDFPIVVGVWIFWGTTDYICVFCWLACNSCFYSGQEESSVSSKQTQTRRASNWDWQPVTKQQGIAGADNAKTRWSTSFKCNFRGTLAHLKNNFLKNKYFSQWGS